MTADPLNRTRRACCRRAEPPPQRRSSRVHGRAAARSRCSTARDRRLPQADRTHVLGHEGFELPGIEETTEVNLALGRRANPEFRRGGISLNTSPFPEAIARRIMERIGDQTGLPVADPMRGGFDALAGAGFR